VSDKIQFTLPQLVAARAALWHTSGEPLATLDSATDWLLQMGLVPYAPRPLQFPAPAPSLAEAALGAPALEVSLAQLAPANALLERLVASGAAIPLNLTGALGETPDFLCSPQALPFVFTLRGDKNWKQVPAATGSATVSPLAVALHKILVEHGPLPILDLVLQAGREVTEAAVLRALGELWAQLRVLPRPQVGAPTLWELTSARYTRQMKAGSNAGVPTALSALISLYLGAAIAATAEEVEVFLSPLAARSRIRDVVHGLLTAGQFEENVFDGKTLLHLSGTLPHFEPIAVPEPVASSESVALEATAKTTAAPAESTAPSSRIHSFKREGGMRPPARRAAGFTRPWEEERASRPPRSDERPPRSDARPPSREGWKPRREGSFEKPARPYQKRVEGGVGASRTGERKPYAKKFGDKPYAAKSFGDKKPYARKFDSAAGAGSGERKPYAKKFSDKPFGDRKPYVRKTGDKPYGERKPYAAKSFSDKKPYAKKFGDKLFAAKKFGDKKPFVRKFNREGGEGTGERRPFTKKVGDKPYGARPFGDKKPYARKFSDKPYGDRKFGDKKPFVRKFDREGGENSGERKPYVKKFGDKPSGARKFGEKKPYIRKYGDKPFGAKKFGDKPFGGKKFGDRKPGKSFGAGKKFTPRTSKSGPPSRPRKETESES
jgi:hypothetical protein